MTKAFIIIGDAGMRKSGAVRSLTGAYDRGEYPIETKNNGILDFFVQIRSLQEVEDNMSFHDFIEEMIEGEYNHILLTLRPANAKDYINKFLKEKWELAPIIVFIKDVLPDITQNYHPIYNTDKMCANKIAALIRDLWNWV